MYHALHVLIHLILVTILKGKYSCLYLQKKLRQPCSFLNPQTSRLCQITRVMFCLWLVTEFSDLSLVIKIWQALCKYLISECMNEWCFYNYSSPLIETFFHFLSSQCWEFSLPYFTSYLFVFILPSPNQTVRDNFLKGSTMIYTYYITSMRIAE